jgi:hypothetical protein
MALKRVLILISIFSSFQVFSKECLTHKNLKICVGDRASANNSDGEIIGISENQISLDFTNSSTKNKGVKTFKIDHVFFNGCLEGICSNKMGVGLNDDGEIIGVNPTLNKIAIKLASKKRNYSEIKNFNFKDVTIKEGCLGPYCFGDLVTYKHFDGVINGVNLKAKKISINFSGGSSKYSGIGTYDLEMLGIGKGCYQGLCVGDLVICRELQGNLISLNPYLGLAYVQNKIIQFDLIKNITVKSLNQSINKDSLLRTISSLDAFNKSF